MKLTLGTPDPKILTKYLGILPSTEYAALVAWLSQFYNFQLRWLLEQSKRAASVKARQIGWSHTTAGAGVLWGAFHGEHTTIISKGEEESKEVLDKAKRHAGVLAALGSRFAEPIQSTFDRLVFRSGGRIIALPSTGGRGFTGNLVLDEFAYHQHADKTWDAAVPAMRLGDFRLRVISTPNGTGNAFANLIEAIRKGDLKKTVLHEVTIEDAERDGYPVDWDECWEDAHGDPRLFDQLYRCKFLDGNLQYIPSDLFNSSVVDEIDDDGEACGGLDIGETRDRTVLAIVKRKRNQKTLVHIEAHQSTDDALLDQLAKKAFEQYNCIRLCVDKTGIGAFPAKRMRKQYGRRLEPLDFTLKSKEDLATGLYDALATSELRIPRSYNKAGIDEIPLLRDDVLAIRRIVTAAGNVRYDAQTTSKGHADRAWALMLALHAAGRMSRMFAAMQ
jgi:phage FluMu gp28-like protein